jgi:hypothetical protein
MDVQGKHIVRKIVTAQAYLVFIILFQSLAVTKEN